MTVERIHSNQLKTFNLVAFPYIDRKGRYMNQERLLLKDPHDSLLKYQVQRLRPDSEITALKSKKRAGQATVRKDIPGFRVHSLGIHILCQLATFFTLGAVCKSFSVKLGKKKVYVNTNSYDKWRKLNGEALSALNVVRNPLSRFDKPKAFREEINNIHSLLRTPIEKRHAIAPGITTSKDPFELTSIALAWAKNRIESVNSRQHEPSQDNLAYRLAAFYILLSARVERACTEKVLRISDSVVAHNRRNPQEEDKKVVYMATGNPEEPYVAKEIHPTDALSSIDHPNNPIKAKLLVNEIGKKNPKLWSEFIRFLNDPVNFGSLLSTEEERLFRELEVHINSIAHAMQDQFTTESPGPQILPELKIAYAKLARSGQLNDQNINSEEASSSASLLAAFQLLRYGIISSDNDMVTLKIDLEDRSPLLCKFKISDENLFEDQELKLSYDPAYVTPLSGKLLGETHSPVSKEALEFVSQYQQLSTELKDIFEKLVQKQVESSLNRDNKKDKEALIQELLNDYREALEAAHAGMNQNLPPQEIPQQQAYLDFFTNFQFPSLANIGNYFLDGLNNFQLPFFGIDINRSIQHIARNFNQTKSRQFAEIPAKPLIAAKPEKWRKDIEHLFKLSDLLQRIGRLIKSRYLTKYEQQCVGGIEFLANGKIKVKFDNDSHSRKRRSEKEHLRITKKYFPDITVSYPGKRKEEPRMDQEVVANGQLYGQDFILSLYHVPHSNAGRGSCCVGALAQAVWGKYDPVTGEAIGPDESLNAALIQQIRNAVAQYIEDNATKFFKYVEVGGNGPLQCEVDTPESKMQAVLNHTAAIRNEEYFCIADLDAFSKIVGSPIHVISTDDIRLNKNGSLRMNKINDHYDSKVINLKLTGAHYDHMRPKKIGIKPIGA